MDPISPKDITDNLENYIPPEIIKAVNSLLEENFKGRPCTIKQVVIINRALRYGLKMSSTKIFDTNSMDFEPVFEKSGWDVEYESPSYGDSDFDAYYTFSSKVRSNG